MSRTCWRQGSASMCGCPCLLTLCGSSRCVPPGSKASACLAQGAKYSVEAVWGHTTVQQLQKRVQNRRSDFNACKCMTLSCR